MIEVINRELLIPREEYNIGTCYDDNTETRHFHLKRVTSGGVDLAALTFNLDIQYADGNTDAASLVKEVTDKDINLVLTINNSMLQVPGTVLVQIRALDEDGVCKWTSYKSAFFVEDHINTPGHYEGNLTQLEQYEAEWGKVRDNVNQLNLRMDEVVRIREESPATEVEEEIIDARIGADNVAYGSLGSAIRKQFEDAYEAMEDDTEDWTAVVAAEATARQTADNTLQGNINSEASTRATQDGFLQTQIDQIIAPSGEAPSAAEVENARIGADGVTYDTLGNAIRTQVTDLKSALAKQPTNFFNPSDKYIVRLANVDQTGATRENILSTFNTFFYNLSYINTTNWLFGLTFCEIHDNNIELMIKQFGEKKGAPTSYTYHYSGAITSTIQLIDSNSDIALTLSISASAVSDYLATLTAGTRVRVDGRNISGLSYSDVFISKANITDITNRIFKNAPRCYAANSIMTNSLINTVRLPINTIANIKYIQKYAFNGYQLFRMVLRTNDWNSEYAVDSSQSNYKEVILDSKYDLGLITISSGGIFVIVDTTALPEDFSSISFMSQSNALFSSETNSAQSIVFVKDYNVKKGYYNNIFSPVMQSGYFTAIIPINKECDALFTQITLDKYANIAFLDANGFQLGTWVWTDGNGNKYSGDSTKEGIASNIPVGTSYILVSMKIASGDTYLNKYLILHGYDAAKIGANINDFYCILPSPFAKNVGNYRIHTNETSIGTATDIINASESNVESLPLAKVVKENITFAYGGKNYVNNSLCDIDDDGTKYFVGQVDNGGTHCLWKMLKNGAKAMLFYGDNWTCKNANDETIVFPSAYDDFGWFAPYLQSNGLTNGIKCLPDGELLVWLLGNKITNDNEKIMIVCKTTNGQLGLDIKIATSREVYTRNNRAYTAYGYPAVNNGVDVFNIDFLYDCIAITEYGSGTPSYWFDQNVQKNGNGIVGKVWLSTDCGNTFYKVFDFDEKINGDASDVSDDNWRWADSRAYRMNVHMHGIKYDPYVRKLFWTNGDSVNNLFYADIDDLIGWCTSTGTAIDPTELTPQYTDNEVLPDDTIVFRHRIDYALSPIGAYPGGAYNVQPWCMFPTQNALLFGHDTIRKTVTGIQHTLMNSLRHTAMDNIHFDLFCMLDKRNPSNGVINGLLEHLYQKSPSDPILAYHTKVGIFASYDGMNWKQVWRDDENDSHMSFMGTFISDPTNGTLYMIQRNDPANGLQTYIVENY